MKKKKPIPQLSQEESELLRIVLEIVSTLTAIPQHVIMSSSRKAHITEARCRCYQILRSKGITLTAIARMFNRDLTCVLWALRKSDSIIKQKKCDMTTEDLAQSIIELKRKKLSDQDIASRLGTTRSHVVFIRKEVIKEKENPSGRYKWTLEEDEYLLDNYKKIHHSEIAKAIGRTPKAVYAKMKERGLVKSRPRKPKTEQEPKALSGMELYREMFRQLPVVPTEEGIDDSYPDLPEIITEDISCLRFGRLGHNIYGTISPTYYRKAA